MPVLMLCTAVRFYRHPAVQLTVWPDATAPYIFCILNISFNHQWHADGSDVNNKEYCEWRTNHLDDPISTLPPCEDELFKTFNYLVEQGYHEAIVTTLSHKLSDSADVIRKMAAQFPQLKIHVIDTGTCCMPEGFFAMEAERLLRAGLPPQTVVAHLESLKPYCHIVFGLSSLKSLSLGGTLSRVGASFRRLARIA